MAIEKLRRYDGQYIDGSVGRPLALCENGDYALYAVARTREDALLEALKPALSDHEPCRTEYELWSAWQYRVSAWKKTVDAIRQIEGSR